MPSTLERLTHVDDADASSLLIRRRWLNRITIGLLAALVGLAVLDGVDLFDAYGPETAEVRATAEGVVLEVEYTSLTRPALASPFRIRVEQADGFTGPITLAVSRPWIEIWDENGMYPGPSAETGDGDWVEWEFDQPDGTVFEMFYDARLEPARQESETGTVELRDGTGAVIAAVDFETTVRP